MVSYQSLTELEDAHDEERATARRRIETAEDYLGRYRSQIDQIGEAFTAFAAREGVGDDPDFRRELQRVAETSSENVSYAGRRISELEDDYDALLREHDQQRERFLSEQHSST